MRSLSKIQAYHLYNPLLTEKMEVLSPQFQLFSVRVHVDQKDLIKWIVGLMRDLLLLQIQICYYYLMLQAKRKKTTIRIYCRTASNLYIHKYKLLSVIFYFTCSWWHTTLKSILWPLMIGQRLKNKTIMLIKINYAEETTLKSNLLDLRSSTLVSVTHQLFLGFSKGFIISQMEHKGMNRVVCHPASESLENKGGISGGRWAFEGKQ